MTWWRWRKPLGWALLTLPGWGPLLVWAIGGAAAARHVILAIVGVLALVVVMALGVVLLESDGVDADDDAPSHY